MVKVTQQMLTDAGYDAAPIPHSIVDMDGTERLVKVGEATLAGDRLADIDHTVTEQDLLATGSHIVERWSVPRFRKVLGKASR